MKVHLRPAQADDSEFIFEVKKAALGTYIEQTWGWDEAFQRTFHTREFEPGTSQIISVDGREVGWLEVESSEKGLHLSGIYVLPEWQGRGIGTGLLRQVMAQAAVERLAVTLDVLKVNTRAKILYERLGFAVEGESGTHYKMRLDRESP